MDTKLYERFSEVEDFHWWFQARKEIVLDFIKASLLVSFPKILDIGCGTGLMLNEYSKMGIAVGIDSNKEALALLQKRHPDLKTELGALPNIKQKNQVDMVSTLDVLEHIQDDAVALKNINQLLVPGGFVILTVPAYRFLWSPHDRLNFHQRRYTKHDIKILAEKSHFTVEKLSYFNTLLFPAAVLYKLFEEFSFRFGKKLAPHVALTVPWKPLNTLLKKIFVLERFLLKKTSLPFGVSLVAVLRKK